MIILQNFGFSLLTTLIGLAILATAATLATTTGHSNAFAFGTLTLLEERALARDAVVPVAGMMVGQAAIDRTPLEPLAMPLNGRDYTLTVRDAAGLVDLNTAEPEILTTLFESFGADPAPLLALRARQHILSNVRDLNTCKSLTQNSCALFLAMCRADRKRPV